MALVAQTWYDLASGLGWNPTVDTQATPLPTAEHSSTKKHIENKHATLIALASSVNAEFYLPFEAAKANGSGTALATAKAVEYQRKLREHIPNATPFSKPIPKR